MPDEDPKIRTIGRATQEEIERVAIMETTISMIRDELDELLSRKTPWLAIAGVVVVVAVPLFAFGFQNLIQLQIIIERQAHDRKQLDALSLNIQETRTRLGVLEVQVEKLKESKGKKND
jgi:hypothetical protein